MKKLQIGIMGSMADLNLSKRSKKVASEVGKLLAERNIILVYGFEGDHNSLSEIAARSCQENGGLSMAFLWGEDLNTKSDLDSLTVSTGLMRGGGREYSLVRSCDGLIAIGGGSGTLGEIAIAYQHNIPTVVLEGTGGWSDKLANSFLDDRKRRKIKGSKTVKSAIDFLIKEINVKK
jgi:uncharacterized protein (TIGR00725 family)